MVLPEESCLLRIFIGETDHHDGQPLYQWIVSEARKRAGRGDGAEGYHGVWGAQPDTPAKIERLSEDLPIVVEIVDTRERLEAFLGEIDSAIDEGVATMEKAFVKFYRSGKK